MVSLWPWKSAEDAASFEKALSTLSTKITKATARNDVLRQKSRRVRVMWTLYAGFAYILAFVLLLLVTGWQSWGAVEISIVAGGPVVIYGIRTGFTSYYDYRIRNTSKYVQTLQKERDETIERLKTATKYNSTQQLLEKYGSSPKPKDTPSPSRKKQDPPRPAQALGQRTGIPPPPTANIPRGPVQQPSTPQRPPSAPSTPHGASPVHHLPPAHDSGAEFAPNAFAPEELARQYTSSAPATFTQHHWYDRIMDALLGEDETQAKNRFALICDECRLVNGQAPPGTRELEDIGRWRCGGCGAWNGKEKVKEDVVAGLVENWKAEREAKEIEVNAGGGRSEETNHVVTGTGEGSSTDAAEEPMEPPSRSTRSRSKAKGKGKH